MDGKRSVVGMNSVGAEELLLSSESACGSGGTQGVYIHFKLWVREVVRGRMQN